MKEKIIFECRIGSHLYGLNNKDSDEDFFGIYMSNIDDIFGFGEKESTVDLSFISKDENGKNNKDAIDRKMISLHKFFALAMKGSANVIEILHADKENIISTSDIWKYIVSNKEYFINELWINSLLGFARKQKLKLMNSPMKKNILKNTITFLEEIENKKEPLIYFEDKKGFFDIFERVSKKGDFSYQIKNTPFRVLKTNTVFKTIKNIKNKITFSNRDSDINEHGYDCKSSQHLIRLLFQCLDILQNGKLNFPFTGSRKETLVSIRNGEFSLDEILDISDKLEEEIKECSKSFTKTTNKEKCQEMILYITKNYYKKILNSD